MVGVWAEEVHIDYSIDGIAFSSFQKRTTSLSSSELCLLSDVSSEASCVRNVERVVHYQVSPANDYDNSALMWTAFFLPKMFVDRVNILTFFCSVR